MALTPQQQIAIMRPVTRVLKATGLRGPVMRARKAAVRQRRALVERRGSDRLSHPALHDLDRKLDRIIDRDGGFFVEAGANDGFTQSNTYWLERFRGWRGLLVEPMQELADEARRERPTAHVVRCALVPAGFEDATVRMRFGDLMSTVSGSRNDEPDWTAAGLALGWRDPYEADVPARTLSSILDEIQAPEVDLLSLDVEGFEAPVLRGLDMARHAPRFVLVEMHDRAEQGPDVEAALGERYGEPEQLSPMDWLYRRQD
ncbi:FkbM family methyltransferase [Conexibacter sp. SYSU D00693]|uniref:FkbM family methyltransferase n=1 Tax=Conexibacter sp. SYSU D00693 TaxID=2812560 RepID=UPI00196A715E|nr:FkbM family methyltransferase [Conexibacter sp. SYSU D00693]